MKQIISLVCVVTLLFTPQSMTVAHINDDPLHFETYEDYGYYLVVNKWGEEQWNAFWQIIQKESGWKVTAQNPTSSAYGLCQTMLSLHEVGENFMTDGQEQLRWCIDYIDERYGTPLQALAFWNANNWF